MEFELERRKEGKREVFFRSSTLVRKEMIDRFSAEAIIDLFIYFSARPILMSNRSTFAIGSSSSVKMRKSVYFCLFLVFLSCLSGFVFSRGVPFEEKNFPVNRQRFKRSIDLISSLEHVSDARLPRDITPVGYLLELEPLLEEAEFRGRVIINITCLEDTDKIILNAHQELEISEKDVILLQFTTPESDAGIPTAIPEVAVGGVAGRTTEINVAPVPVGAARLVPVSSSFMPENACASATSCPQNPDGDKSKKIKAAGKAENSDDEEKGKKNQTAPEKSTLDAFRAIEKQLESASQKLEPPRPEVPLTIIKTERQPNKDWYVIHVSGGLKRGRNYRLEMKFAGHLLTNSKDGFFLESYADKLTGEKRRYAATQMRPNHARRVFPCFDEPAYKVPIEMKIARHPSMEVISNMPLAQTVPSPTENDWVWDHFEATPPISTYSIAILISNLEQVQVFKARDKGEESDGVCFSVKVRGRKEISNSFKNAARIAPKILREFENYFEMSLPVPKLDLVALPGYAAIPDSNWGLVFFKESDLHVDENLVKRISKEMVYQWIGNLVTPHWWTEVHLNKALCNFVGYIISLKVDLSMVPNSGLWTKTYPLYYEYGRNQPYKQLPSQKPPKTVTKSELILRMLNYTLSGNTFRKAIQQFLKERKYKTFTRDDIWNSLTEQAGIDGTLPEPANINRIADSWMKKERLPMVDFVRNYENNSAEVTQSVFIRDHLDENSTVVDENLTWVIPLVVIPENNLEFTRMKPFAWMKDEKKIILQDLPSPDEFVIVNPEEIGPFVVNYDTRNWYLISRFLEKDGTRGEIPAATRAKFIHDSLNLAYAGKLRFDVALNVTKFLLEEKDPIVWQAAFNMFDHVQRHLEGSEVGKKFQEYVKFVVSNVYSYLEKMGANRTRSQERMYKSAKSALCNAGYGPCVKEARMQWKKWMDFGEPDSGIPILQSHFCWVFKWGTNDEWEFGLERYLNYPSGHKQADRYYLLKTLASCTENAWNVERLLNMTMLEPNSTMTDGNARFVLSVLSNRAGYTALFNFLSENWDAIRMRYDGKEVGLWDNIVSAATRNFKDQQGLDMVSELYLRKKGDFGTAESVIEQSLRHIKKEVKWNEDNLSVINEWLTDYLSSNENSTQIPEMADSEEME